MEKKIAAEWRKVEEPEGGASWHCGKEVSLGSTAALIEGTREGMRSETLDVRAHPGGEGRFIEGPGGEAQDGLGGGFFGGGKARAV